ncbi:MAG: DUF4112 domain-containing protein [Phycisphaerales bacterium]
MTSNLDTSRSYAARLAHLLDDEFVVPGADWRFGIDPLIGLLPGIGDTAGMLLSLVVLAEARTRKIRWSVILKMLGVIAIDWLVGSVPIIGDAFDFWYKPNLRNLRLLEEELARREGAPPPDRVA